MVNAHFKGTVFDWTQGFATKYRQEGSKGTSLVKFLGTVCRDIHGKRVMFTTVEISLKTCLWPITDIEC